MSNATLNPVLESLADVLGRSWWLVLLRGVAAILFGVATIAWPQISLLALMMLYAAYALADGVIALITAFRGGFSGSRWLTALGGLVSIAAAVLAVAWPGLTALGLVLLIGAWAIARGVFEIAAGIVLRKEISDEWMLIAGGALSALFGALVLYRPGTGALAILWLIAGFAIVFGVVLVVLAFRLRRMSP